jgi:RND family efflux transporter MFP subunit
MAGRVEWVGVSEGDRVRAGQILVKLDGYDQADKEYRRLRKLHQQGYISDMELERAKIAVDNASIVSPISGLVTEKTIIAGEAVSPGISVMTVVDIDNPWVEIQIDEVDIAAIKLGQRVRFTTDAFPDKEFFGKITWINKKAELKKVGGRVRLDEEDLVFRAKVKFEDGREILKPGMSVYAEVVVGKKEGVLVVPREAVALREGKRVVFKIEKAKVLQSEVEMGLKDAEKVEMLKGLSLGEQVAVSNLDKLKDGSRVKVAE